MTFKKNPCSLNLVKYKKKIIVLPVRTIVSTNEPPKNPRTRMDFRFSCPQLKRPIPERNVLIKKEMLFYSGSQKPGKMVD